MKKSILAALVLVGAATAHAETTPTTNPNHQLHSARL